MITRIAIAGLLAISLFLSGCSGVLSSDQPPKQTYLLEPLELESSRVTAENPVSLDFSLSAVPGLDTDRIQAIAADARLNRYANARWPDFLPEVLTSVMRRSLLSTGQFSNVTPGTATGNSDWSLNLEAQRFYGVQNTPGSTDRVNAEFSGILSCSDNTHRLQLSASKPVNEERLALVVRAHQEALNDVTRQLWESIQTHCL